MDETGWLIEHSGEIPGDDGPRTLTWMYVRPNWEGLGATELGFTTDASKALRFARREDAESVLQMYLGSGKPEWFSKPYSVTEHMWHPAEVRPQWLPIEDAPEGELVVVHWLDESAPDSSDMMDFDCKEDGVWTRHEDHREYAGMVAPAGSKMPPNEAPYTGWMPLPPRAKKEASGEISLTTRSAK